MECTQQCAVTAGVPGSSRENLSRWHSLQPFTRAWTSFALQFPQLTRLVLHPFNMWTLCSNLSCLLTSLSPPGMPAIQFSWGLGDPGLPPDLQAGCILPGAETLRSCS